MPRNSPTAARRSLARFLRERRRAAGIPRERVGQYVGKNPVTITRLENAEVRAEVGTVAMLLELYEVPQEDRGYFIDLARSARRRGWWQRYSKDMPSWFSVYVGLEAEASQMCVYEVEQVPDLLQTPAYSRALIESEPAPRPEEAVFRRVDVRQRRQHRVWEEDPVRLRAIMGEGALYRSVGGDEVMRDQLRHLLRAAGLANVTLQVLPFAAGAHAGTDGAFVMLRFPDPRDRDLAYVEYRTGAVYLEEPEELESYDLLFDDLTVKALDPSRSAELIERVLSQIPHSP
ncbi:helix-turn-helix domain-containing protein [Streptomonospora nanhaiensis]|uniref:helix-turn-helix domain-containing protein n=1 Tax=Streptomonospora nanhaiensis TaxID=1323731 RepID=UPI001C998072|nr:helix-turn-helix transcriptional regulator [Streptomonospora nanhaiensis]MBX9391733.1 helix-turn-helix domain-containing protein [Streptomonospora nanhaiensis]